MKKPRLVLKLVLCSVLVLGLAGCATETATTELTSSTVAPAPKGKTIIGTSPDDSGPGTFRQALLDAHAGDTIIFDPAIFPPDDPVSITLTRQLPLLVQGHVTIDASNAGVILDGSQVGGEWTGGISIGSEGNTIRGLQIIHFSGAAIVLRERATNNVIGGDRKIGSGPSGQGNTFNDNMDGVAFLGASSNTIIGNLMGIDASTGKPWPNRGAAIWLEGASRNNVIGPDNVVAFNLDSGIIIHSPESTGNTITRNSIHDNESESIRLPVEAGLAPIAPAIFDFDLKAGTAAGATSPGCIIEVFSDDGGDGEIYEGSVTADQNGAFSLDEGSPFAGPSLTATATGPDGSTSAFSIPTSGTRQAANLQEGNSLPKSRLLTRPSRELADNRIGISYGSPMWLDIRAGGLDGVLNEITDLGVKRVDLQLCELEGPIEWSGSEYDIPSEFDQFIDDLAKNGVAVNYQLHFWDKAGHANGKKLSTPRFKTEEQVQDFLDYIRFIVRHFKGRIQYYTLWSEPDAPQFGGIKLVEPSDYINLAERAVPIIRQEDPQAKVVLAPIVLFFSREYLFTVLRSDVMPMFDVVSWHGIYDVTPGSEFFGDYYYEYPSLIREIKQTASTQGFQGEYWGTEISWRSEEFPTIPSPVDQPWAILDTDRQAAKYYARGIVTELGMDVGLSIGEFKTIAPWSYPTMRRLNTVMAGTRPIGIAVEIQSEAKNIVSYGFTLPNGDKLVALWTDGVAVDYDPGIPSTLTIPSFAGWKATAVDVLNGYEQELVSTSEDGNSVIRDFRLKDYPIIIRLSQW